MKLKQKKTKDETDEKVKRNNEESDDVENQQPDGLEKPQVDSHQQLFNCKDCDKMCHKENKLKRHVSTHSSAEKCKCTTCAQPFSSKKYIINHKVDEHGAENQKQCEVCRTGFKPSATTLRTTMKKSASPAPFANQLSPSAT